MSGEVNLCSANRDWVREGVAILRGTRDHSVQPLSRLRAGHTGKTGPWGVSDRLTSDASINRMALPIPTDHGRVHEIPYSATRPRFAKAGVILACESRVDCQITHETPARNRVQAVHRANEGDIPTLSQDCPFAAFDTHTAESNTPHPSHGDCAHNGYTVARKRTHL